MGRREGNDPMARFPPMERGSVFFEASAFQPGVEVVAATESPFGAVIKDHHLKAHARVIGSRHVVSIAEADDAPAHQPAAHARLNIDSADLLPDPPDFR